MVGNIHPIEYCMIHPHHEPPEHFSKSFRIFSGGIAGMIATTLVHPLDLLKVRIQVDPKMYTTRTMARKVVRYESARAMYNGLTAGLMRQATYTTTRLAVFAWLYDNFKKNYNKTPATRDKVTIGIYAGLLGALAGNPSEVALVRMMAANTAVSPQPCCYCHFPYCYYSYQYCEPETAKKPYKGVFDAFKRIMSEEGARALWRGGTLTLARSIFVSVIQIGTYLRVRDALANSNIGKGYNMLHLYTSLISSFFTTLFTLPIDLIKTKYQVESQNSKVTQQKILVNLLKRKGPLYLWKGFVPYFVRMTIHTFVTIIILNKLGVLYHGDVEEKERRKKDDLKWWEKLWQRLFPR